mgnify:CR=1 FL=1
MKVLTVDRICKRYGKIKALDEFSLEIEAGNVFGILGPNGSGKTTLLGCILEVLTLDSGSFLWFGGKFGDNYRNYIGAILETPNFYPYLNADENLKIISEIKNVTPYKFDHLLDLVGLADRRKSKFKTYSLGMKQRLAIAATLIGDPEVLIFDEPTNGLDPSGIADVREILLRIAGMGKTVIMSSHILDEVEKICSHVGIIKNGKLLAQGHVGEILGSETFMEIGSKDADSLTAFIEKTNQINIVQRRREILECTVPSDFDIEAFHRELIQHRIFINHLVIRKRRLEEEFLQILASN